jgi:hypothetical protein
MKYQGDEDTLLSVRRHYIMKSTGIDENALTGFQTVHGAVYVAQHASGVNCDKLDIIVPVAVDVIVRIGRQRAQLNFYGIIFVCVFDDGGTVFTQRNHIAHFVSPL